MHKGVYISRACHVRSTRSLTSARALGPWARAGLSTGLSQDKRIIIYPYSCVLLLLHDVDRGRELGSQKDPGERGKDASIGPENKVQN